MCDVHKHIYVSTHLLLQPPGADVVSAEIRDGLAPSTSYSDFLEVRTIHIHKMQEQKLLFYVLCMYLSNGCISLAKNLHVLSAVYNG